MVSFSIIKKTEEFELSYGSYNIYFTGGFTIENLENLDIQLVNVEKNEKIKLHEKFLKTRDIINRERAILCYNFDLLQYSSLKLTINNPEILSVKRSYNKPSFTLLSFIKKNEIVDINNVNVIIK
jgi:hypothetical protein